MIAEPIPSNLCLLFAYGMLQPGHSPPRTMTRCWQDHVAGTLYDLGPYPAAVSIGTSGETIPGYVLEIRADELPAIDLFEDVAGGLYERVETTTLGGWRTWIYQLCQPLPEGCPRIERWPVNSDRQTR